MFRYVVIQILKNLNKANAKTEIMATGLEKTVKAE